MGITDGPVQVPIDYEYDSSSRVIHAAARTACSRVLDLDVPNHMKSYAQLRIARSYRDEGDTESAIREYRRWVRDCAICVPRTTLFSIGPDDGGREGAPVVYRSETPGAVRLYGDVCIEARHFVENCRI